MHQETLLIIDDEISIRESLSLFLSDEGYEVLTAENGEKGLEIFFNEKVDLILTDLRMPVLDGLEVMSRVHAHNPDIPMVVVSGAGKRPDIIKALQMGAKDYITKPITDLNMIRHVIQKALENKHLIDENKAYRRRLEKSEARYRTITEQIAEGVFTVDKDENLTFCNPAFCQMMGYDKADLNTMNLKELATPESLLDIVQQTLYRQQGHISRYEVQMISKAGKTVHLELSCSPLQDDQQQFSGAIAVARDITKIIDLRKKFQKFLRQEENRSANIVTICANCKKVRGQNAGWQVVEEFFSHIAFSHGICPICCAQLYPDIDVDDMEI